MLSGLTFPEDDLEKQTDEGEHLEMVKQTGQNKTEGYADNGALASRLHT